MTASRATLVADIKTIANQLDKINGTAPGTALKAIYYWLWPPEICGIESLQALHRDAVALLAAAQAGDLENWHAFLPAADDACPCCGREIFDDTADICDRCAPTITPPERHSRTRRRKLANHLRPDLDGGYP
jgi:hypothetical protein